MGDFMKDFLNNILDDYIHVDGPTRCIPLELKEETKREFRKIVDEYIHPDSDLGQIIHKGRQIYDQTEERIENSKRALDNLTHFEKKAVDFNLADHLFVRRGVYTHHAIYVGGGRVIHYSSIPDGELHIQFATLEEFSEGKDICRLGEDKSPLKYSREEAVWRARERLGEKKYDLISNNCECFVRWCRSGGETEVWQEYNIIL